jgi:NADPH:quinone reductase-like Zn-dependent oxidoreductase
MKYKALVTEETGNGYVSSIKTLDTDQLPDGEVLVKVFIRRLTIKMRFRHRQ